MKLPESGAADARQLFVRHAKKDGRSVAVLTAVDYGDSCVVEAEVFPVGARNSKPMQPGPYTFADSQQATAFVTEAVEALMYLGCDIQAQSRGVEGLAEAPDRPRELATDCYLPQHGSKSGLATPRPPSRDVSFLVTVCCLASVDPLKFRTRQRG